MHELIGKLVVEFIILGELTTKATAIRDIYTEFLNIMNQDRI